MIVLVQNSKEFVVILGELLLFAIFDMISVCLAAFQFTKLVPNFFRNVVGFFDKLLHGNGFSVGAGTTIYRSL